MAFFGLKLGLDLEMWAVHPNQKFQGVSPPLPRVYKQVPQTLNVITVLHTPSSMVKPIICTDILRIA